MAKKPRISRKRKGEGKAPAAKRSYCHNFMYGRSSSSSAQWKESSSEPNTPINQ